MNVKTIAAGISLLLFALIVSVSAIDLRTSEDSISIHSTEGQFFVYVKNTANEQKDLLISADGHKLSAFVEPYQYSVSPGSTGGAYIRVTAPDCFRGSEAVTVYAQLCSYAVCETASERVVVYVEPARQCSNYDEGFAPRVQFISGTSCGSTGCFNIRSLEPKRSSLVSTASFDTTSYNLRVTGGDTCTQVKRGEVGRIGLTLYNRGAAGNFDLRVVSDSQLFSFPSKDFVSLQRNEQEEVFVDLKPVQPVLTGRYFGTFQALHLDELISEKDICIDLVDEFSTTFSAPSKATARTSRPIRLQLEIGNQGTTAQHYSVSVSNPGLNTEIYVDPQEFMLNPGAKKLVDVVIDTSEVPEGDYRLHYLVLSEETEQTGETLLSVEKDFVAPKAGGVDVQAAQSQKDNVLTVTTHIVNEENTGLNDLEIEVQGLPENWKVSEIKSFSIGANSRETIQFEITANSDEDAFPTVLVLQNGKVIASDQLPKISGRLGGFTGLFTLNTQNMILGLVILAAILIFFVFGRREETGMPPHAMESIKRETEAHGH